ncbi:MAG: SagB/ThcOx family dehydrogenase, partial [Candidatus Cloacimonadaceae bacterium]|nr:SagB/ThcOx family dehydrogenase [Candidatus Cloacimonadaceae bacterium]
MTVRQSYYMRIIVLCMVLYMPLGATCKNVQQPQNDAVVELPTPNRKSNVSLEKTLASRRSIRSFKDEKLALQELGQILWAAQGITEPARKYRTAPSAGATFPIETYVLIDKVADLTPGIYHYDPNSHSIMMIHAGDFKTPLRENAARQGSITQAPFTLIFCADFAKIRPRYKERSERYVFMELGHIAQNVHLQ